MTITIAGIKLNLVILNVDAASIAGLIYSKHATADVTSSKSVSSSTHTSNNYCRCFCNHMKNLCRTADKMDQVRPPTWTVDSQDYYKSQCKNTNNTSSSKIPRHFLVFRQVIARSTIQGEMIFTPRASEAVWRDAPFDLQLGWMLRPIWQRPKTHDVAPLAVAFLVCRL